MSRLYLNIGFIIISVLLVYFAASYSLNFLKAGEQDKAEQELIDLINEKTVAFGAYLKDGNYEKAEEMLQFVENNNPGGKFNHYITEMNRMVLDDFNLISQSLYNDTINSSIAQRIDGLKVFREDISGLLEDVVDENYNLYLDLKAEYRMTHNFLNNAKLFDFFNEKLDTYIATVKSLNETRTDYQKAVSYMESELYLEAITFFLKVSENDIQFYADAQKRIEECNNKILQSYMSKAQPLIDTENYQDALNILYQAKNIFPDNTEISAKIDFCNRRISDYRIYEGPIYHIFFHSLIVYPQLAFDGDHMSQGYNNYMVTVDEFKKILVQLYENNYVLYNINRIFETVTEGERTYIRKLPVYVPEGKKPLILSIDDVSYYDYMKDDGFASRLTLDDYGKVANIVKTPEGEEILSYEGDVMSIVDSFVEQYPDFSFQGAKGIIALTGYEGVLGYRTNKIDAPNFESIRNNAIMVANALKASGWQFANHSYSHSDDFTDGEFELSVLQLDTERWKREVEPIVGNTNIYITPFGYQIKIGSDHYNYLASQGYNVICVVGGYPYINFTEKALMMDRQNVDGIRMFQNPEMLSELFNVELVIDKTRPFNFNN